MGEGDDGAWGVMGGWGVMGVGWWAHARLAHVCAHICNAF